MKTLFTLGVACLISVSSSTAQTGSAKAAVPRPATVSPATPQQMLPKSTAPAFPPVDPKNFVAKSPTVETVNSFLHALWGYDPDRMWSVAAIEPTIAPGVVRVQAYIAEKTSPGKLGQTTLYVTPDGKHAIAGEVVSFGQQPFAETRNLLQQRANGPARGAKNKDLELVEFADLQCSNCKAAQGTMDQLQQDFPQAHIVFENFPLTTVHPFAFQAAAIGYCVQKTKGDSASFIYMQKVYDLQADLTKDKIDGALQAAITASGADTAAVLACASTPAAHEAVNATIQLAADAGITNTPTLVINGRALPIAQIAYETLKRVIVFQGSLDGVTVQEQPSLKTLK
ncbi:MAG: thioredoxin domain-containing protein [Janthinobacterium lividum]